MTTGSLAEVITTQHLDALLVVPRSAADATEVRAILQNALPGTRITRRSAGVIVDCWGTDSFSSILEDGRFTWHTEAKRFLENRQRVKLTRDSVYRDVTEIKTRGFEFARQLVSDLPGIEVLDNHQVVNVAAMTLPDSYGLCVFDEQGAGKTVTFIFAFDLLAHRDQVDVALVVAPKSMVPEWPQDLQKFKGDLYRVAVLTGPRREKTKALYSGADFIVANFETVVTMEAELRAFLRGRGYRTALVVDESFFIKNPDAHRSTALRRLREWSSRAYVLCGTPAPNSPHDLVHQFNFVDFGHTFAGVRVPEDRGGARPVVQAAIEERGLFVRHLKSQVLPDLPPKIFHKVSVQLHPVQERIYRSVLHNLIEELQRTDDLMFQKQLSSFLAKRTALLQICSNPTSFVEGYEETPCKLAALDDLLEKLIGAQREKVVVWSFYTASLDAIVRRYARFNPVRYDGTVSRITDRRIAVERFQKDAETMLFVANPAAAGAGLTLHRARVAVYESLSNQAAHYLQSIDRIHRRGQERETQYMILLADKTLEIAEFDRLTEKERSAQQLLGDQVEPPITRESMLREALEAAELLGVSGNGEPPISV